MPRRPRVRVLRYLLEHAAAVACDVPAVLLAVSLVVLPHALGLGLDGSREIDLSNRSPPFHLCYLPEEILVRILQKRWQLQM